MIEEPGERPLPSPVGATVLTLLAWFVARWNGSSWEMQSQSNVQSIIPTQSGVSGFYNEVVFTSALGTSNYFMESSLASERTIASASGYFFGATFLTAVGTTTARATCVFGGAAVGEAVPNEVGMVWAARFYKATL